MWSLQTELCSTLQVSLQQWDCYILSKMPYMWPNLHWTDKTFKTENGYRSGSRLGNNTNIFDRHIFLNDSAIHLFCYLHIKKMVQTKLSELKLQEYVCSIINDDIFHEVTGLADCEDYIHFRQELESCVEKRDSVQRSFDREPCFSKYLISKKNEAFENSVISSVHSAIDWDWFQKGNIARVQYQAWLVY